MDKPVTEIIIEKDIPATMRDQTILRADVYRPAPAGQYPVLLQRTPYGKDYLPYVTMTLDPLKAAAAGYVVVIQDVRGRFSSDGDKFYLYRDEFQDGYDSVEWAASLPYANGNVGMFGASYMGITQWQAAIMQPPHLKTIFPVTWGTGTYVYRGGAFELGEMFSWSLKNIGIHAAQRANLPESAHDFLALVHAIDNIEETFEQLPLKGGRWQQSGNNYASFLTDILDHDTFDDYHRRFNIRDMSDQINVPAFCVTGWYDTLLGHNLEHFRRLKNNTADDVVRNQTRLMIGPWTHSSFQNTVGELNFGLAASGETLELAYDLTGLHLWWFDYFLKGIDNGITGEPPIKIFVMGKNRWRSENEWPPARARYTPYYFHSRGHANSAFGDGELSTVRPLEEPPDYFLYNPRTPVPTRGGNVVLPLNYSRGPVDQSSLDTRGDILIYTSVPLNNDLEVTGPVKVILYAASSALDTDFTAKLCDLFPGGRSLNIVDGIIRARYRDGIETCRMLKPGEVYRFEINLWATSYLFKAGHRLRVAISSSNFPHFDRNPNTGKLARDSTETEPALQTIFHNSRYPSHILLPVI